MNDNGKDSSMCAAFGCLCFGTQTSSGSGTKDWFCSYHFGRDAGSWQRITAELNRLSYIVEARQKILIHRDRDTWPDIFREVQQSLRVNQRGDLCHQAGETVSQWINRLHAELDNATRGKQRELPKLASVASMTDSADTFKRVAMTVPEHA